MWLRLATQISGIVVSVAVASGSAYADDAVTNPSDPDTVAAPANPVDYGVTLRLRNVRAPRFVIEMFTERATGSSDFGFGADFVRRRGTIELMLGFEYERIQPDEGVFIESGTSVPTDEADYIVGPDHNPDNASLGWLTFEFMFFNHVPIRNEIAFRYGFGAGLGIVMGDLWHYNIICAPGSSNASPEPGCKPPELGGTGTKSVPDFEKYNLPPVFPVISAIVGFQFKPTPKATINLEAGIRTFPFFGISGGYFF